jgi:DNA-binding NtrC family response regulator
MSNLVILLVEQDGERRQRLFTRLLSQGYEVIESCSPLEALRIIRQRRRIDLFIVSPSLESPGDGVELPSSSFIMEPPHVILLAGQDGEDWAVAARAAGVTTYVGKRVSCDDILAIVSHFSPSRARLEACGYIELSDHLRASS